MKRAIVSGIDGFIGRHLARQLLDENVSVVGISRRRDGWTDPGLERVHADFSDREALVHGLKAAGNERDVVVFHLSGISSVKECELHPDAAFDANTRSTLVLLEAMRELSLTRFVFASSGLVYDAASRGPIEETAPTRARSVYAATKLASESLLEAYAGTFDFAAGIARFANVYGQGMNGDTVLGELSEQNARGAPLSIRSGEPVRDFLFVDDAVSGLIEIARALAPKRCAVYNISYGEGISIRNLAAEFAEAAGTRTPVKETNPTAVGAVPSLVLSNARARREIGWQPRHSLRAGLGAYFMQLSNAAT